MLPFLLGAVLTACGGSDDAAPTASSDAKPSKFSGTLDGKSYDVDVSCSFFSTDSFTMRSDKTDVTDSNSDGLIISGDEFNGGFSLTIVDQGNTYSIGRLEDFTKGDNSAQGSGQLIEEGTSAMKDVEFTVTCR